VTAPHRPTWRPDHASGARHENLPAPHTHLIGRENDSATVRDLVLQAPGRLVTLTGTGGCGKTQLALLVAAGLVETFSDGVWLVELANVQAPHLVPYAIASVLGRRERAREALIDTLVAHLETRAMLLVLDNCEHLIDVCADLAERLLVGCPRVRLLATSRERLRIGAETIWRVPSLPGPDPRATIAPEELLAYPAVELFVARAHAIQPDFALSPATASSIAGICARLEGLPLALELAAARVSALSLAQILERLDDSFRLLIGGSRTAPTRQQTLRATLDWSHGLLSAAEQAVFRRLAVFSGGWNLEAAEAVCSDSTIPSADVLELLTHLVDKSLVVVAEDERIRRSRYRLLEPIRQYTWEWLFDAGEAAEARQRHLVWLLGLAEQADPTRPGSPQEPGLTQLEAEYDNLRAALAWGIENDPERGLRLAAELAEFWRRSGHHAEGRRWLHAVLAAVEPSSAQLESRARVLLAAGQLAVDAGELSQEQISMAEESVGLFRDSGDQRGLIEALQHLGRLMLESGQDAEHVYPVLEESLRVAQTLGDQHGIGFALANLAYLGWCQGRHSEALELYEQAVTHIRASGDALFTGLVLGALGWYTFLTGDLDGARRYKEESLAILRGLEAREALGLALLGLAHVVRKEGDRARLRLLLAESIALLREVGSPGIADWLSFVGQVQVDQAEYASGVRLLAAGCESVGPRVGSLRALLYLMPSEERDAHLATARSAMGEAAFQHAWAAGQAMTIQHAIAEALAMHASDLVLPERQQDVLLQVAGLTAREVEVLRLVAKGQSNKQIAAELVLSVRTVERHITNLYGKIDARGKADATAYAFTHGLL
jgi:predicted ATPase/DNA-binding CsgD family transcriptional regulator